MSSKLVIAEKSMSSKLVNAGKRVKYCGVRGGGGIGGRQNPIKLIASFFFVIKIVKYFGIGGGAKILQTDNGAPSLCHKNS